MESLDIKSSKAAIALIAYQFDVPEHELEVLMDSRRDYFNGDMLRTTAVVRKVMNPLGFLESVGGWTLQHDGKVVEITTTTY